MEPATLLAPLMLGRRAAMLDRSLCLRLATVLLRTLGSSARC